MENLKKILKSLITNPLLMFGYWLFCYELASLCRYGRINNNIYILLLSFIFIVFIIIYTYIKKSRNKELDFEKAKDSKVRVLISIVIIITITSIYGISIYKSGTNYGGKLAWVIQRLKNERKVEFINNNIYENGVEGIFNDINKKYTLPENLYMSDNFELEFNSDGTITSFETFVYGKSSEGKDKSCLIIYDKNKSKDIRLIFNGYINTDYDENKLVEPLVQTVDAIKFKDLVNKLGQSKYGLAYFGKRSFGYNSDGIVYIDSSGEEYPLDEVIKNNPTLTISHEIIGYTVSIFAPGKEEIIPARYNLMTYGIFNDSEIIEEEDGFHNKKEDDTRKKEYYLSKEIGYRLDEVDYALGSIFYSMSKTFDGGKTWEVINEDPFGGAIGEACGITFINEKLGFLVASRNGGANGELYRTNDGGKTFYYINYAPYEVKLDNGASFTPFDFPDLPYEESGFLNMLVGQGNDGDYNGDSKVLYQSNDKGKTWKYIKEVKNPNLN